MKIHILYKFVEGPWGGGNQFLKALREYFRKTGVYAESPDEAQVVFFNSHHCLNEIVGIRQKNPGKILVHRVDGPVSYVRGRDRDIDEAIVWFNNLCADGTVFQSRWSQEKNYKLGMKKCQYETIVTNAPDPTIFCATGKKPLGGGKIKLIATSWSGNIGRGFDIYQYLDEHLNFNRYEMTFVGNSPIEFKNIRWIKPVPSGELAGLLREHDVYITASRNDPCSNALIEALHCGLPAVARNDGGHPEIVGQAGVLFEDGDSVIEAIEKVAQNYKHYQARINLPTLDDIGQRYYEFALSIYKDCLNGIYRPKRVNLFSYIRVRIKIVQWKAQGKVQSIRKRDKGGGILS